jgi:sortase A
MTRRDILSGIKRPLLVLGLLLVAVLIAVGAYKTLYSQAAVHEFWPNQSDSSREPVGPSQLNPAIPDFRLWSARRIEAYQMSLVAAMPPPLGILKIPSIKLEVPVFEGSDDLTLNRAVGHIEGTSALGESGNVGVAGHRDGFFRGLKDVQRGAIIDLYSEKGNTRYVVNEILIVSSEEVSVLAPQSKPTLTLVTCYPFYFVGSAPLRYIVHASIADHKGPGD